MRTQRLLPLALVATALLVVACGTSEEADDPGPSPSASESVSPSASVPSPSSSPSSSLSPSAPPVTRKPKPQPAPSRPPSSEKPVRGLVSASGAARGPLETTATRLANEAAVQAYAATLEPPLQDAFRTRATTLLAHVPVGETLYAQTVYDGCDNPDPATITATTSGSDVVLRVQPPKATKIRCLVAERSVALLSV